MRKKSRKLELHRETLRYLSDASQRGVAGGLRTRTCTGTEECTQGLCDTYQPTELCTTDNTANSCNGVFSCGSCYFATCDTLYPGDC
jgi:hypothetical protein